MEDYVRAAWLFLEVGDWAGHLRATEVAERIRREGGSDHTGFKEAWPREPLLAPLAERYMAEGFAS